MKIAFFAPHKPLDHKVPSGDLMIGRSLHNFLRDRGHEIITASRTRLWNIINKPQKWPSTYLEYQKTMTRVQEFNPDLWLTYHSYHKSPDLFGPNISQKLSIPYVIYQGVFATKHRRSLKNWPGYMANKNALIYAEHVFANKEIDFCNLSRIIIPEKLSRTHPGIEPDKFSFCEQSRRQVRNDLQLHGQTVIMSTAMLRDDVKAKSVADLINAFGKAAAEEPKTRLIIAGDGSAKKRLERLAREKAGDKVLFLGRIHRDELYKYYSTADIFAFPGINEALGMVYLEAQSAGLPVVAYSTRGPVETVADHKTGLLSAEGNIIAFAENMLKLIRDKDLRKEMSKRAPRRIAEKFDLRKNLSEVEAQLLKLI